MQERRAEQRRAEQRSGDAATERGSELAEMSEKAAPSTAVPSSGDPGAYDLERGGVHLGKNEVMSARSRRSFNRDINQGKGSFVATGGRPRAGGSPQACVRCATAAGRLVVLAVVGAS